MKINESNIIDILGEELYYDCFAFFQEILERKCYYKIIMTRRCFSLFKIFYPILCEKGIQNQYGKIITDNAIGLYLDDIRRRLVNLGNKDTTSVLVVDDIIIYGRTINALLDNLLEKCDEKIKENIIDNILVRCIMKNMDNSQIKREYCKSILSQSFGSKFDWKKLSCKFSSLIKSSDIANTSYIVSCQIDCQESIDDILEYCKKRMTKKLNDELAMLKVYSYITDATVEKNSSLLSSVVEASWIRVYVYEKINSVVISPIVVLKDLTEKEVDDIVRYLSEIIDLNKCCLSKKLLVTDDENEYSSKIKYIILLLSHCLLRDFLSKINIENIHEAFDYNEILRYNFSESIAEEFTEFHNAIFNSVKTEFVINLNDAKEINDDIKIEKFFFKRAMLDNQSAITNNSKRLEGTSKIKGESIFSKHMMPTILSFIDNGKAALRTVFNNKFVSLVYPGEQAFRIIEDKYREYLAFLYILERYSILYQYDSYSMYKKFVKFLCESNKKYESVVINDDEAEALLGYIEDLKETNQQISDAYSGNIESAGDDNLNKLFDDFVKKEVK